MTSKLRHNTDMLMGLAERLALLAVDCPGAYLGPYTSVMARIEQTERGIRRTMTQNDTILHLLRRGHTLTKMDMMIHHKIATPTARITELRQRGHDIKSRWKRCPIDGSEYVEYFLNEEGEAA